MKARYFLALVLVISVMLASGERTMGQPFASPLPDDDAALQPEMTNASGQPQIGVIDQVVTSETPHPILSDIRIRRSIAYCADRSALVGSVYGYLDDAQRQVMLMDTFIPKNHWAYTPPPITYTYPFSPAAGQALLDAAGWSLGPGAGYRTNSAGYELALKFTTTDAGFRVSWALALENQLRDNCGIRLVRFHVPGGVLFSSASGLQRRDFELAGYAWVGQSDPGGVTLYACDQIPTPANNWAGQNYMGWCNTAASDAVKQAGNSMSRAERIAHYAIAQREYATDMVSLPLFTRLSLYASAPNLTGFAPNPGENYYAWNIYSWTVPATNTLVLGFTQEPSSLFPLVDSSFAANLAASLIYGRGTTTLDFDTQARLYQSIPTLENGGATTQTVSVMAGARVLDANSNVVTLAFGTRVKDVAGQIVTYTGSAIGMPQMVITGSYLSGLRWSSGAPLLQADLQLWDNINCAPTSGATSYFFCDRTANREYLSDTTARYTLVPGYLPGNYTTTYLPGAYPSERVLSDLRMLKDVPASEWASLPEIKESPIGLGPYRIVSWVNGQRMTFERSAYFTPTTPLMQNAQIRLLSSAIAAQELISGNIHFLGFDSGADAPALFAAAALNQVMVYPVAGTTMEHIDMNLGLYTEIVAKPLPPAGGVVTTSMGIQVAFPTGALSDTATTIIINQILTPTQSVPRAQPWRSFTLSATTSGEQAVTQFLKPITLTIDYDGAAVNAWGADEVALNVAFWNGSAWTYLLPCAGCGVDTANNRVTVVVDHFSEFVLASDFTRTAYLPSVRR